MWKFLSVTVIAAAAIGCEATRPTASHASTQPNVVTVIVDKNGELMSGGFGLEKSDLPSFVQELHGRSVNIKPFAPAVTGFDKAVAAKKELEAAGASSVTISGG